MTSPTAARHRSLPRIAFRRLRRLLLALAAIVSMLSVPAAAADIAFTVTMSEPVAVSTANGTPSIAIDVGGVARTATYRAGSGSNKLTFAYAVQQGDFDADGIAITQQNGQGSIALNGGAITDLAGNPPASYAFTPPDTTALKVQTYQPGIPGGITTANAGNVSFTIAKAPPGTGYSYSYSLTGANGGSLTANGVSYSGSSITVSNLDISSWPLGTVTLSVTITGPSGPGQPVSVTVTPSGRPLDSFPSVASAYSVRQLRSAYAGPLMRVRRASDNAQQNIGTTMAGTLDTAALLSFCGSSSCFVTTWYDQSGSGNNAIQATAANQPRIVNAGTVEKNGSGRTALRTLSTLAVLNAGPPMANSDEFTILMSLQTTTVTNQWAWGMTKWPGQVSSNCPWSDGFCYFDVGGISGPARLQGVSGVVAGVPYVATFGNSVSASTQYIRINGQQINSDTTGHSVPLLGLSIMNNYEFLGVANNMGQIGTVSEFIVFPSLLSSGNQSTLETSMKTAFGP